VNYIFDKLVHTLILKARMRRRFGEIATIKGWKKELIYLKTMLCNNFFTAMVKKMHTYKHTTLFQLHFLLLPGSL